MEPIVEAMLDVRMLEVGHMLQVHPSKFGVEVVAVGCKVRKHVRDGLVAFRGRRAVLAHRPGIVHFSLFGPDW